MRSEKGQSMGACVRVFVCRGECERSAAPTERMHRGPVRQRGDIKRTAIT